MGKSSKKARAGAQTRTAGVTRFLVGFGLMFACMAATGRMNEIEARLTEAALLPGYEDFAMLGAAAVVVTVMLFFAYKLYRAVLGIRSERWRLPLVLGMIAGLAAGLGPTEFVDGMLAQIWG